MMASDRKGRTGRKASEYRILTMSSSVQMNTATTGISIHSMVFISWRTRTEVVRVRWMVADRRG